MGDSSSMDRASRFIQEFSDDYAKALGLKSKNVISQGLGQDDTYLFLAVFAEIKTTGGREEVMVCGTQFELDHLGDDEIVALVAGSIEISEDEARERLLKAEIIQP